MNYTDLFADLSEIVTETIPGETKSIKDKYDKSLYESLKNENGELKTLGWAGSTTGIFYYADVLENEGIDVPRTTDELADLAMPHEKQLLLSGQTEEEGYESGQIGNEKLND